MSQRTFSDVACTVCGCVCDDLTLTVEQGAVIKAVGACAIAEPWIKSQRAAAEDTRIEGRKVTFEQGLDHAAKLLQAAHYPLIYGLSRSTTEGQRAAVALADRLGATIDTTASTGHAPSIIALQQVGESTCTLGEVKQRADLVVFWGSDPLVTHPRHIERYCPPRPGREMIVVDEAITATARAADRFYQIEPGSDWDVLWELRQLVRNRAADGNSRFAELARSMMSCKFGIIFFGTGLTRGPLSGEDGTDRSLAHRSVEALLQLATDLNLYTRFYVRRMRRYGDVAGADSVLAWQTGYPFGVNFAAGYPRYNPGEFTGPEMLTRGEPDLCVLVGGDTVRDFPPAAIEHLRRIQVILLDSPGAEPLVPATVHFTTSVYGVHRPGTAYRLDEVPIPLTVWLPNDAPSDHHVLDGLLERLGG